MALREVSKLWRDAVSASIAWRVAVSERTRLCGPRIRSAGSAYSRLATQCAVGDLGGAKWVARIEHIDLRTVDLRSFWSPLKVAAFHGHVHIIKWLAGLSATLTIDDLKSAMYAARCAETVAVLELFCTRILSRTQCMIP